VLDERGRPAAIGTPGELYIGGPGVALGYWRREELTAERFVPDEFGAEKEARLYKTGDLVRRRADGAIEFLGRNDDQVKVRGFRIELGEIETALRALDGVKEAVVVARQGEGSHKRLVAYVTPRAEHALSAAALREGLRRTLPEFMVPSAIVVLDALPLNANGKVDRRRLPDPEPAETAAATTGEALPRNEVEGRLAEIWAKVLRLERVGIHDNFFELGGDSILSIQIVARAKEFGIQLTPKQLFVNQTVAEQAAVATLAADSGAEPGTLTGEAPMTPIQRWFFEQELDAQEHFNHAFLMKIQRPIAPWIVGTALTRLIEHHDALRLRYRRDDGGWRQFYAAPEGDAPLEWIDLTKLDAADQDRRIEEESTRVQASLNLEEGPLTRMALFELGGERGQRLLWVIHHLAVDGVSWRILLEDLEKAIGQLERGEGVILPAKTWSLRQWAAELEKLASGEAMAEELEYWSRWEEERITPLPVDRSDGENRVDSARRHVEALDEDRTRALLREIPAAYNTRIDDALLTALLMALERWTGGSRHRIALEGHGREPIDERADLSRTVGWFTAMYPALLDGEGVSGPGERLKSVKEQARAIPGNGLGYGVLRYMHPLESVRRRLAQIPAAELSFNYMGQFDQVMHEELRLNSAEEAIGPSRSPSGERLFLLEFNASVAGGILHMTWTYSENLHEGATIERLVAMYREALEELIEHCKAEGAGGYTPSDFPEAELDQAGLDRLLGKLSRG
jgi:non-ribosomal peptide synthase protein (TIGR01720 family)